MNKLSIFFTGIIAVTIVAGIIASGELVEGVKPTSTARFLEIKVLGTLTCPQGPVHNGYDLFVRVDTEALANGSVSGSLGGQFPIGSGGSFAGELTTTDFAFSVIVDEETCAGQTGAGKATVATISGTCGIDETVNFSTNTGVTGTFTGKVACI